jgi:hypothetical protein
MPPSLWARRPFRRFAVVALSLSGAVFLSAQDRPGQVGPPAVGPLGPVVGTEPTDLVRYMSPASSHYYFNFPATAAVRLLFLPPELPALESPIPLRSPLDNGVPPPAELAAYVGDLFYPQLASCLAGDELSRRVRLKLEAYWKLKHSLLDELESAIAAARELQGEPRRAALADCAARQAARLQEMEAAAEQIRLELGPRPDGRTKPHEQPEGSGPSAEPDPLLLRTAAFYADGLSLSQRHLLLAMSAELRFHGAPTSVESVFYFSPEGAALRLPATLPPRLATAIAAYAEERRALAGCLLAEFERPVDNPAQLRDLAARQAPGFTSLEIKAEEIRVALHEANSFDGQQTVPALPAELTVRLAAYNSRRKALLLEISASLSSTVLAAAAPVPGGIAVPVSNFTPAQQTALAALNRERDAIRAALVEYRRTSGSAQDRKSIDNLLQDFERARQAQELREEYAEYRTAVLEPGLTPAQRRLLLDGAFQHLALPLPSGEPLPAQ